MRIHVGGIQGVGKDTLIDLVSTSFQDFPVIHFAQRMKEIGSASSHDALLRGMDKETRKRLRNSVFEEIGRYDSCIVNGHYALPIRSLHGEEILGFEMGIADDYRTLFDNYLLIECSAEAVLERRGNDTSRERGNNLFSVVLELGTEKLFFDYSSRSSRYSKIFENDDLNATAERIKTYLSELRGES